MPEDEPAKITRHVTKRDARLEGEPDPDDPKFATRSPAGTDAPPGVLDSSAQRDAPSRIERLDDAEREARELARAKERQRDLTSLSGPVQDDDVPG